MSETFSFSNQQIAQMIRHAQAVYVIQGANIFQIRAYDNAANSIEQLSTPIKDLWADDDLDSVPGIGKTIKSYLEELFTTGHIKHFETLFAEVPGGMFPLVDLPHIGPKLAFKLATALNLKDPSTSIAQVKAAAEADKLNGMPGISKILQQKILESTQTEVSDVPQRMLLASSLKIASKILEYVRQSPEVIECDVLGSMRRRLPTTGDIDIAVSTRDPIAVADYIVANPEVTKVIGRGEKGVAVRIAGLRIDIKLNPPEQWGSLLQHYTGSKVHNIHLRTIAKEKDLSLSEYGIKKGDKLLEFASEEKFYEYLGLQYVPPELREDTGEVEAARKHALPDLIELTEIKGDVHIHTNIPYPTSHDLGASSVAEYLARAEELKYSFIGFSDHNPKRQDLTAAQRLEAVKARNQAIQAASDEYFKDRKPTLKVLKGLEVDILANGDLALEDESLAELDYVIMSIHSAFTQGREITTERILKALANPYVKIFGHPTGRHLGKRLGVEADWDVIAEFCAANNKLLEINSTPNRMDLPFDLVRQAQKHGAKFIINTDSHHVDGMWAMQYGVWTARKGWLEAKDVVSTKHSPF